MEIYFIRHGKTQWNLEKKMQGQLDSPLIYEGLEQLKSLRDRLKHLEFSGIYCSPLGRTRETARLVFPGAKVQYTEGFKEIALGDWEGRFYSGNPGSVEPEENFWELPHRFGARPGGEDFFQVQERALRTLEEIVSRHDDYQRIAVISHSVVIKCILGHFMKVPMEEFWDRPVIYPSSLSVLELNAQGEGKVVTTGDHSHCEGCPGGVI